MADMEDNVFKKAVSCCESLDCANCPIKDEDYCKEWLDAEKQNRKYQLK